MNIMICTGSYDSPKPEKYSEYRNRVFSKHKEKLNNMLRQIKECSLKQEDKARLKAELLKILSD